MKTKTLIVSLAADEQRAIRDLAFTAKCKNTGVVFTYEFGGRPRFEHFRRITEVFVWAMYKRRHSCGHESRLSQRDYYWKFLCFLDEAGITEPEKLNNKVQKEYVNWLKSFRSRLSYPVAASQYRGLAQVFIQMSTHESVSSDFRPIKNAFPKATSLQSPDIGYDQEETKSIIRAAVQDMRRVMEKHAAPYVPRWLNKPAPLDGIAPLSSAGFRSYWASEEYKIWWWENKCDCKVLTAKQLRNVSQGQVFTQSFKTAQHTASVGLREFYAKVGAGDGYVPKYLGQECPIKYKSKWMKVEYLEWYWENKVGCQVLTSKELHAVAPELFYALKDYYGGRLTWFYGRLGVYLWISGEDLVSFYIMLLVRTQLNPSTIQRLDTDCLMTDPTNESRKIFNYEKYRSFKAGSTIPSSSSEDGWPVALVNKVLKITHSFRLPGQTDLWISNSNKYKKSMSLGKYAFKNALREFSKKYDLKHTSGEPLSVQAKLIRPSMAWQEYLRTEDMNYLQSLLGHERLSVTADYLRRVNDPVFKMRRAMHQEAMFVGLTESGEDVALNAVDGLLNHCRDPMRSPVVGQQEGHLCSAGHEVCLGCPNLVITVEDIKKYFCFIRYHEQLFDSGVISEQEYIAATSEKRFIWVNHILPRYKSELIEAIREDSRLNPIGVWSPTSEGSWL